MTSQSHVARFHVARCRSASLPWPRRTCATPSGEPTLGNLGNLGGNHWDVNMAKPNGSMDYP